MFENIIQNNGFNIALSGILVVFSGLTLIATTIHLFNKVFERLHRGATAESDTVLPKKAAAIPEDVLAAITVAIEIYRKIHFETLQSQITFIHGEQQSAWKSGYKYGQRLSTLRKQ
ncbi:MAG TPA: hypothetical protein DHW42_02485 [Candidatus Marinimicrobia bacterium]|nr:hypothetical protein [Candidatus Neomarinimicrobiota bacterium]